MIVEDVVWLSLAVTMIHEFEEIIFIEPFLRRTRDDPRAAELPFHSSRGTSTSVIAAMIGLNFVLFTGFALVATSFRWYSFYFGFLAVFTLHLLGHAVETIRLRRYTPSTVTSFLTLPWMIYAIWYLPHHHYVSLVSGWLSVLGMLWFAEIDLGFLHRNETRVEGWIERFFGERDPR